MEAATLLTVAASEKSDPESTRGIRAVAAWLRHQHDLALQRVENGPEFAELRAYRAERDRILADVRARYGREFK